MSASKKLKVYFSSFFSGIATVLMIVFVTLTVINCVAYKHTPESKRYYEELSSKEKIEILTEHNKWRSQVGVPSLKWSSDMEDLAKDWAYKLSRTYGCRMIHRASSYGENIFWSNYPVKASYVVDYWAKERFYYDYTSNSCKKGKECKHYTQIIWQDTQEVGCGRALCAGGEEIWVCNYNPAGNIRDKKPY